MDTFGNSTRTYVRICLNEGPYEAHSFVEISRRSNYLISRKMWAVLIKMQHCHIHWTSKAAIFKLITRLKYWVIHELGATFQGAWSHINSVKIGCSWEIIWAPCAGRLVILRPNLTYWSLIMDTFGNSTRTYVRICLNEGPYEAHSFVEISRRSNYLISRKMWAVLIKMQHCHIHWTSKAAIFKLITRLKYWVIHELGATFQGAWSHINSVKIGCSWEIIWAPCAGRLVILRPNLTYWSHWSWILLVIAHELMYEYV